MSTCPAAHQAKPCQTKPILYFLQVLLLRLRQACVHPYLAQTKDDGSGTLPTDEQGSGDGAEGSSGTRKLACQSVLALRFVQSAPPFRRGTQGWF